MPLQCTNRHVSHGAKLAIDNKMIPTSTVEMLSPNVGSVPVVGVSVCGPTPEKADAPTTKTTTITSLQNTSAATISSQRRVQTRV